jgi:hypothetical protein
MPHLQFLDLCILLHLGNNLLAEQLHCMLHQLYLHLRFLPPKKTHGFKIVTNKKKTTTGAPAIITVKHCWQPLIGVRKSASLPIIFKKGKI